MGLGTLRAFLFYFLKREHLQKVLLSLYPVAVFGLVVSQFSSVTYAGQNYLSLFGLKINMFDAAGVMMALSLGVLARRWRDFQLAGLGLSGLVLAPVLFFAYSKSMMPAAIVLIGGVVALHQVLKIQWATYSVCVIGLLAIFSNIGLYFHSAASGELIETTHTDFVLSDLATSSKILAATLATALATLVLYMALLAQRIKADWMRSTCLTCAFVLGLEAALGILTNYGCTPMPASGVNLPFLSYGGSLLVLHLAMIGLALACLKRKQITRFSELV